MSDLFEERVKAAQSGLCPSSPEALIGEWGHLVDDCEYGYTDNIHEYRFDLQVRDAIAEVLADGTLAGMPEMADFREKVTHLDQRFRECLADVPIYPADKYSWWHVYPPRRGDEEFAADVRAYGVEIEIVPKYPPKWVREQHRAKGGG